MTTENSTAQIQELKAVASLLDEEHAERVRYLWNELEKRFGVEATFRTPLPHFSYQVAEAYDLGALQEILSEAVRDQQPFSITTGGLGVFTGAHPTLYIPVIRTATLSAFHERLYTPLAQIATNLRPYYTPRYWMPHITLVPADVDSETLADILQYLSRHDFMWEISVDNVTLICDACGKQGVQQRFDFGAAPA
ncbi:MAG: 2'-5' RNA ligase family protein [Anaerolineae bacterium]